MSKKQQQGLSRRQFLGGGAAIAGLFALGPAGKLVSVNASSLRALAQANGGRLVFAAESMGDTLETGLWTGFGSIHVMDNIGEGLVRSNFTNGEPAPGLAESWTVSEDGLTYTFTLRSGVTFHDGTPLTAEAVVRSLTRQGNAEDSSYLEGLYMYFGQGNPNWQSVTALDESTVELVLIAPDAVQLHRLSRPSAYIISPAAMDAFGPEIGLNMVTAGPFSVQNFVPGQEVVLAAFDGYWGGRPFLDEMVIRGYPDEASILAAMEAGEVNFTLYAPFTSVSRLAEGETTKVEVGPALVDLFIGASAKNEPSSNLDIRLAVNYAINRDNIIQIGLNGYAEYPASILSPTDLGFDENGRAISTQNLELAAEHITRSGYTTPIPITLSYENNRFWPQLAELIAADLNAVGFEVTLEGLDSGSFWGKVGAGEVTFSINQRSTFVPDPDDKTLILHSTRSPGGQTFHELLPRAAELDALIDAGMAEQDPEARIAIYQQIQALVLEEMPYIYLAYLTPPVFMGRDVMGVPVEAAAAGRATLRDVFIEAM
jgi:peptide/nickel transport system substrate-binding protein